MFDNASDNIRLDKRNYGIDLLRLVSMFLIVVLHSLSRGALVGVAPFNIHYEAGFLIEALTYCAVNCFALISGYVGVDSKFKYRRIVPIWLQVVFYCLIFTMFFMYLKPDLLTNKALLGSNPYYTALTPVIHNTYWYFTAYFALFFFIPFINKGMRDITIKQAYAVIISVIFVYIALPYFAKVDLFKLEKGYSATWIIFLYVIGAALKKIKIEKLIRNKYWYLILYVLTAVMAWGGNLFLNIIQN